MAFNSSILDQYYPGRTSRPRDRAKSEASSLGTQRPLGWDGERHRDQQNPFEMIPEDEYEAQCSAAQDSSRASLGEQTTDHRRVESGLVFENDLDNSAGAGTKDGLKFRNEFSAALGLDADDAPETQQKVGSSFYAPVLSGTMEREENFLERYRFAPPFPGDGDVDEEEQEEEEEGERNVTEDAEVVERSGMVRETGQKVLIKRVARPPISMTTAAVELVRREAQILKAVRDAAIPALHEYHEFTTTIWSVRMYRETRSLGEIVRAADNNGRPLSDETTKSVMNQLFSATASLFLAGFAHLRVCDETVGLDAYGVLILKNIEWTCEYGRDRVEGDVYAPTSEKHGSSDIYVAPEVFAERVYNARKAVMWSCGVLLYFMVTGQTEKLSNLEHPSFEHTTTAPIATADLDDNNDNDNDEDAPGNQTPRRLSSARARAQSKIIMYPSRFSVPSFARAVIPKMLTHDPRRRAELIEVASRIPKDYTSRSTRPLMEIAWMDYKTHVGPNAHLHVPDSDSGSLYSFSRMQSSAASSIFSVASRMSNPFASLLRGKDESRRKSAPATSRFSRYA